MSLNTNNRYTKLWNDVSKNQNDISNIKSKTIKTENVTVSNKKQILKILEKFSMIPYTILNQKIEIIVPFQNITSNRLSGVNIVPLFYSESQIIDPVIYTISIDGNLGEVEIISGTNSFLYEICSRWQYIEGQYVLKTVIDGRFRNTAMTVEYPLYLDFDIVIENNCQYITQNGYKS